MLKGIDDVVWHSLTHAYGPALDVPSQIRDLASPEKELREEALRALYANIWHQGTVYEATAYAAPFLIELLKAEEVQDKDDVLVLLAHLATGTSYHDVHQHLSIFAEEAKTPQWQARIQQELVWVKDAKNAVVIGLPIYRRMLAHREPSVRDASSYLLASLGEAAREATADIFQRLAAENDEAVKTSLVRTLAVLGGQDAEMQMHILGLVSEEHPKAVRLAAAMALAGIMRAATPSQAIAVLLDAFQRPDDYSSLERSCWQDGDTIASCVSPFLATLEGAAAEAAEDTLIQALDSGKPLPAATIAEALLHLALQGPIDPGTRMSSLTPRQQRVMRALAANGHLWGFQWKDKFVESVNTSSLMRSYNLPSRLPEFKAFVDKD